MEALTDGQSGTPLATLSLQTEGSPNSQMDGGRAEPVAPPKGDLVVNSKVNGDGEDHSEDDHGVEVEVEHAAKKKKKKSKSRSKSKRGLNAPTGFEEFHADAPITPEEYAADRELYSSDQPFIKRILAAIQRFERTRKMSSERRDIFYKYLAYGGVDISPNMFQSAADLDQSSMSKDELAMAMSKVSIGSDKYDLQSPQALYAVDFLACMQAFLSRHAAALYGFETYDQVALVTTTLERFMDYLLQHDVCSEYKTEVQDTRDCCRAATSELWACAEAYRWLPGDFNIACSTLFGGVYSENYDGEARWNDDPNEQATFVGMAPEQAMQIVKFGVAGAASEAVYQKYLNIVNSNDEKQRFEVVSRQHDAGFTIKKIFQPTKDCIRLYKSQSTEFRPVGRIIAVPWVNPDAPPEDLTPTERGILNSSSATSPYKSSRLQQSSHSENSGKTKLEEIKDRSMEEYTFFIELPLISQLRVGMHLEATIHELNCGIWWFDDFRVVYPSFDTYLTNDLMLGWKEPRWLKGSVEYDKEREREDEEEKSRRLDEGDNLTVGDGGHGDTGHGAEEVHTNIEAGRTDGTAEG